MGHEHSCCFAKRTLSWDCRINEILSSEIPSAQHFNTLHSDVGKALLKTFGVTDNAMQTGQ